MEDEHSCHGDETRFQNASCSGTPDVNPFLILPLIPSEISRINNGERPEVRLIQISSAATPPVAPRVKTHDSSFPSAFARSHFLSEGQKISFVAPGRRHNSRLICVACDPCAGLALAADLETFSFCWIEGLKLILWNTLYIFWFSFPPFGRKCHVLKAFMFQSSYQISFGM